jgi:bifunctional non-homologous end joining protein LigD
MPVPVLTAQPPRIAPIVPVLRSAPFSHAAWFFEPKYDGFRGMLSVTPQGCVFHSKRGNQMRRFQGLAWEVGEHLKVRDVVLDGEIIALDDDGRISFWDLMRGRGTLAYAAFDLLWINGHDLCSSPLRTRKKRLERVVPAAAGPLSRVPCFEREGLELFAAACRLDLEGIVAKQKADGYGPETTWFKVKNTTYTQAEGRRELFERRFA